MPYKGGAGQAIPAMVAGEVQVAFFNMASLLPHVRSGRLTPKAVVDRLHGAVFAVLTKPDNREGLAKQMMSVEVSRSPQEFTEQVRRETQAWGDFVRDARIKID